MDLEIEQIKKLLPATPKFEPKPNKFVK